MTFQTYNIDGTPVIVGPSAEGQAAGGLIFRVGIADETVASLGITHLVEHLALNFLDFTKVHANGQTDINATHFHIAGTEGEVVDFLNQTTASLRAMPWSRLQTEKSILRTEASRRAVSPAQVMPMIRHGAQGYGLSSLEELGLGRVVQADVQAWIDRYFVHENAVVWLATDELPSGLNIELPHGKKQPLPDVTSVLPQLPAFYRGMDGVVVAQSVVRRSTAARIYSSVLEQALFRELRQMAGLSYTVGALYEVRDNDEAAISAIADGLPESQDAVVGGFIDVLAELRYGKVRGEDLDAAISQARTQLNHPNFDTYALPGYAHNELTGYRNLTQQELVAELDAVTPDNVHAVALEAHESLLVQAPYGDLMWAGIPSIPEWSQSVVLGERFNYLESPDAAIVIGHEGISFVHEDRASTVLWSEAVGVCAYPDGARTVIGRDGFRVNVEPTLLVQPSTSFAPMIDAKVNPDIILPMPDRRPDEIPQPGEPQPAAGSAKGGWRNAGLAGLNIAVWVMFGFAILVVAIGVPEAAGQSGEPDALGWSEVLTFGVISGLLFWWAMALKRKRARLAQRVG